MNQRKDRHTECNARTILTGTVWLVADGTLWDFTITWPERVFVTGCTGMTAATDWRAVSLT